MRSTSSAGRNLFSGEGNELRFRGWPPCRQTLHCSQPAQPQDEDTALSDFGARPNLAFMGLHDLIHDGQAQTGASFKLRLKGSEDFLHQLPASCQGRYRRN